MHEMYFSYFLILVNAHSLKFDFTRFCLDEIETYEDN